MKIIFFLLASLVGVKCQQKVFWPVSYVPRIHLLPFLLDETNAAGYVSVDEQDSQNSSEDDIRDLYANFYPQSLGRNKVDSKFLQNGLFSNLLATTWTSTVWTTLPSTLTTIVVSSCIPASHFTTSVNGAVTITSSGICARRKRSLSQKFLFEEPISPSPKQIIDVTDVPKATTAEIRSSKEDPPINPAVIQRRNRAIVIRTTVTSTLTSYSFTSTVSKTVSLITGSNLLICRPPGFAVC